MTTATNAKMNAASDSAPNAARHAAGVTPWATCGRASLWLLAALLPPAALAELTNGTLLGAGLRSRPAYDGSATQQTEAVPVLRYFGPNGFARSTQGVLEAGARGEFASGLHAGVQLAYEPGRQASGVPFLESQRVADVGRGASVGLHVEWDHSFGPMPVTLLARARKHTEADRGLQVDLRLSAGLFKGGRLGAGAFVQTTWADARSTDSLYGTGAQSVALAGLPRYTANAGWLQASGGLLWSIDLSPAWVLVGSVEARRLRSSAARSPLAERVSNHTLSAGLARQF